jgi:hypothetical protein
MARGGRGAADSAAVLGLALVLAAAGAQVARAAAGGHDYSKALSKSILYFEAQCALRAAPRRPADRLARRLRPARRQGQRSTYALVHYAVAVQSLRPLVCVLETNE